MINNAISVTCYTFGMLELKTLTLNKFKNQSSDTLKLLGHNYNHQHKGLLNKKLLLSVIVFLSGNFIPEPFY